MFGRLPGMCRTAMAREVKRYVIGGIFLICGGLSGTIVGMTQNNNLRAQISSLISSGTANPGTVWLVISLVAVVAGIALMVVVLIKEETGVT